MSTPAEKELREAAFEARGDLDEESTEVIEPARLSQMVSLRLDGDVAAALRELAIERGCSLSELLREAASLILEEKARPASVMVRFEVVQGEVTSWESSAFATGWHDPDDQSELDYAATS